MYAVLDRQRCMADNAMCMAIPACPQGAITFVEDANEPLGGRIEIDKELCTGCGECVEACCGEAIELQARQAVTP